MGEHSCETVRHLWKAASDVQGVVPVAGFSETTSCKLSQNQTAAFGTFPAYWVVEESWGVASLGPGFMAV